MPALGPTADKPAGDEAAEVEPGSEDASGSYAGKRRLAPGRGIGHIAEHDSDDWWRTWSRRTTAVLGGVLVLATALIWAWLGTLAMTSVLWPTE